MWFAAGGAIGGVLRFWIAGLVTALVGSRFPLGTLVVNASGALMLGLVLEWSLRVDGNLAFPMKTFLIFGLLGSYTTVSSFSLQTLDLWQRGRVFAAGWNVALTLGICLSASCLGLLLGQAQAGGI